MPSLSLLRLFALTAFVGLGAQVPPSLELGFEERVRFEDWNNLSDHTDLKADFRSQYRFRTRLWAQWRRGDLEAAAGLLNENRKITRPDAAAYNGREVIIETLWLGYKFTPALSARVGRQNLTRGEGFVLFDGTPGDGSRSMYFDAIDVVYAWGTSKLELLGISNPQKERHLPMLNEIREPAELNRLAEWDETAFGLYLTTNPSKGLRAEAYALHKTERNFDRTNTRAVFQPDRRFTTLGARLVNEWQGGWTAAGEGALQWGWEEAPAQRRLRAWGGYGRVRRAFDAPWKPSLGVGYVGLSGQDPRRPGEMTAWNPVFSRWPKWSELYVYSQAPEKGVGYWTNTSLWELEARCAPSPSVDLRVAYCHLKAMHPLGPGPLFGQGRGRGRLLELRADWRLGPGFKTHAIYEHLRPGSFYQSRDGGHYFRAEFTYTWGSRW